MGHLLQFEATGWVDLEDLEAALAQFADLSVTGLYDSIGPAMTCSEAEAFHDLFDALGFGQHAEQLMLDHAEGDDDEEDSHFIVRRDDYGCAVEWGRREIS